MATSNDEPTAASVRKPRRDNSPTSVQSASWYGLARTLLYAAVFLGAIAAGFLSKDRLLGAARSLLPSPNAGRQVLYWTSPMDPNYRSDKPGKDSMGMALVPVYKGQQPPSRPTVIDPVLSEHEYATVLVDKGPLARTIHTVGTIEYAEPLIGDVTLKIDGWLEKLYVDYEGQPVHRGDPLFDLYSPDLVATQEEYLISLQAWRQAKQTNNRAVVEGAEQNVSTARQRLRFWDVTDKQIDELARTGNVRKSLTFYSPFDGIVVQKHAFEGKFLPAGQLLYRVADLSKIWVHVFAYQDQLHCVYEGQGATLHLANLPDRTFQGKVVYIYPYLDPTNRAVKVRLEFENPGLVLKPGMYADIQLEPHRMGTGIKIPETAILQTGQRSLVYVSRPNNKFEPQEVTTGMELDGAMVEVLTGLHEGQQIVAAPSFLMDSESRLRAVNRRFGPAPNWTEQMPAMEMPGMKHEGMPGMKHGEPMPAVEHEETMPGMDHPPGMKHEHSMPGTEHERSMPDMEHPPAKKVDQPMPEMERKQPMSGMQHEHQMPAAKGGQP